MARICKEIKKAGMRIDSVCHDNDASTMCQILAVFPKCKELLDIGHASKNLYKKTLISFGT